MEKFVDRIMETDRKAREMIDQAQREKTEILAKAKQDAEAYLARQAVELDEGMRAIDRDLVEQTAAQDEAMNQEYLQAKRALDTAFETGREAWLQEITARILAEEQR